MNILKIITLSIIAFCACAMQAQNYKVLGKDICYVSEGDEYRKERCKLDIYAPKNKENWTVLVWIHGGGISGGNKGDISINSFVSKEVGIVTINYRLSPKIKAPEAIYDAAEAVAWVLDNISKYGGDPKRVFVGGHSAGAYLSGMVGFNPEYLAKYNHKNTDIAGMCLSSGQMTTHFRVKKDLNYSQPQYVPVIDKLSVLGNVDNYISPMLIITGQDELERPCRVAENHLLYSTVKKLGKCKHIEMHELGGYGHNCDMAAPYIVRNFMRNVAKFREKQIKNVKK